MAVPQIFYWEKVLHREAGSAVHFSLSEGKDVKRKDDKESTND